MTKAQESAIKLFNNVKEKAIVKKMARSITEYTYTEDGWEYKFYEIDGKLAKVEAYNHRELIEVKF